MCFKTVCRYWQSVVQRAERVDRKVNVSTVLWKSPIITQYLVESMQQIIGMAWVGFERLIAKRMTYNFLNWFPSSFSPSKQPADHPLHYYLHKIIFRSPINVMTKGYSSTRKNVSMELVLGNGQIRIRSVTRVEGKTYSFSLCPFFRHQGSVYFVTLSYANRTDTQSQKSTVEMTETLTLQSCK